MLTTPELETFVRDLMARPETWAHLVAHDPEQRRYELLLRDDRVEVWLICWMEDHDTGFHDHDLSAGAVAAAIPPPIRRMSTCRAATARS